MQSVGKREYKPSGAAIAAAQNDVEWSDEEIEESEVSEEVPTVLHKPRQPRFVSADLSVEKDSKWDDTAMHWPKLIQLTLDEFLLTFLKDDEKTLARALLHLKDVDAVSTKFASNRVQAADSLNPQQVTVEIPSKRISRRKYVVQFDIGPSGVPSAIHCNCKVGRQAQAGSGVQRERLINVQFPQMCPHAAAALLGLWRCIDRNAAMFCKTFLPGQAHLHRRIDADILESILSPETFEQQMRARARPRGQQQQQQLAVGMDDDDREHKYNNR